MSNFNFTANPGVNKQQIIALSNDNSWVNSGSNLILLGPSGVGKTHLAMAIGARLIEHKIRVLFKTGLNLVQELLIAKKNYELTKYLEKLDRYSVVILDDLGYVRKNEYETSVLFEFIAERYEHKSLIVTCNQPFSEWDSIFADKAMTIAAVDRIVHHSKVINITGDSYRKQEAMQRQNE